MNGYFWLIICVFVLVTVGIVWLTCKLCKYCENGIEYVIGPLELDLGIK